MTSISQVVLILFALATVQTHGASLKAEMKHTANPIRRVVTMLQMMQNKIEAEGKKAEELYEKFMCYCKTTEASLTASIEDAETRIPQLESDIKETTEMHKKLGQELVQHKDDRADAKEAVAKALAIRDKEAAEFATEAGDTQSNIDALAKAIPAIEKGMSGSFLQTSAAAQLRRLSLTQDLSVADRDMLSAFLSGGDSEGSEAYSPGTGEILGMLKQMKDEMEKDLAEISGEENTRKMDHESMVAAKKSEIAADTQAIEEKTAREGEAAVQIATLKHDLEDTQEDLVADQKYLADLKKSCAAKTKEFEAQSKSMAQELIAISETIKILNDDDALELFKKTIPSASAFLQVEATSGELRAQAMQVLRESRGKRSVQRDLILLAMHGKKAGFEKVITMIDDMVTLLGKEQVEDDNKKEYCETELDKAEDKKKGIDLDLSDVGKAIDESQNLLKTLDEEMSALKTSIEDLDVSVARATAQRKEEHAEYTTVLAANNAAKDLIGMAKNRMQKFYNPKLYKPPPKRELSEEERITLNMGGTLAPTEPPGGIAGTGITALDQEASFVQLKAHSQLHSKTKRSFLDESDDDPPPPPAAYITIAKKSEEAGGVLAMMDNLIADIDKEILEMEMEEKDAQEDYEGTMADASEKRAADSKALTEKESTKAELDAELAEHMDAKKASMEELNAVKTYLLSLHGECDWLLENYETRKTARANEIDAMKKAKAVLSGADYSLLQITRHLRLQRK